MKSSIAVALVLAAVSGQVEAYKNYGSYSCGDWIQYGKTDAAARFQLENWAAGLLSGAGYIMAGPMRDTNYNSIYTFIDQYCAKNPLNTESDAVKALIDELLRQPGAAR